MKRNLQLDFLRFIGVFLVMVNHAFIKGTSVLDNILSRIQIGGWTGVDLFFVLSGYLVSGLIIKEHKLHGTFNAKRFLIRRGFKIYPSYYLYIIFAFILGTYFTAFHAKPTLSGLFHESIFVANYFDYNNGFLWSISVEEHFYFILALVFLILIRYKKIELKTFVYIYVFLLIIGLAFRLFNYFHYSDYDFSRDYTRSHFRFDSLFFGVLLAYLVNYKHEFIEMVLAYKYRFLFIALAIGLLATNFIFNHKDYRIMAVTNLAFNPICFGYLMLNVINIQGKIFLAIITPLSYVGKYSYSIYLFHRACDNIAIHYIKQGGMLYYLVYFSTAIIGGIIISKCVEYPVINFREKYFPSRSKKSKPVFQEGY